MADWKLSLSSGSYVIAMSLVYFSTTLSQNQNTILKINSFWLGFFPFGSVQRLNLGNMHIETL